jgi:hypothetical protein
VDFGIPLFMEPKVSLSNPFHFSKSILMKPHRLLSSSPNA